MREVRDTALAMSSGAKQSLCGIFFCSPSLSRLRNLVNLDNLLNTKQVSPHDFNGADLLPETQASEASRVHTLHF